MIILLVVWLTWYVMYFAAYPFQFKIFLKNVRNVPGYLWFARENKDRDKDTPSLILLGLLGLFAYPLISLIYERKYAGALYIVPVAYDNDRHAGYSTVRAMQSKYFWYKTFTEHGIRTPRVVCRSTRKAIFVQSNVNETRVLVAKPNNGTDGVGIYKTSVQEFLRNPKPDYVLQDLLRDCFTVKARSFRVCTCVLLPDRPFFVAEYTQVRGNVLQTNRGENQGERSLCLARLSDTEKNMLEQVFGKLFRLHVAKFSKVPFVGFDVMLTCQGPFVLEGNLGGSVPEHLIQDMKNLINRVLAL